MTRQFHPARSRIFSCLGLLMQSSITQAGLRQYARRGRQTVRSAARSFTTGRNRFRRRLIPEGICCLALIPALIGCGGGNSLQTTPGASRIVFIHGLDIWSMNPGGSGQINLTRGNGTNLDPAVTFDGSKIAFGRSNDLWVMNADGSGQTQITSNTGVNAYPSWSPDGSKLVIERHFNNVYNEDIWVMNADGSGQVDLTNNNGTSLY